MLKFDKIMLVLSTIGIWVSNVVAEPYLVGMGYFLIMTFGILHGSNDIMLIQTNSKKNKVKVLVNYILSISLFSLIFYIFPKVGLIVFIFLSAYHFGEQHLKFNKNSTKSLSVLLFRFSYGFFILNLLFIFHVDDVASIVKNISKLAVDITLLKYSLFVSCALISILFLIVKNKLANTTSIFYELFLILIFSIIFKTTPLIWGFALYFIIWHSIPSIKEQCEYVYGEFNGLELIKYIKSGFIIWLLSIMSFIVYFYVLGPSSELESILFSFIAAITFPHVFTIYKLFRSD